VDYDLIREQILLPLEFHSLVKIIYHNYILSSAEHAEDPYNDFRPSPGKNYRTRQDMSSIDNARLRRLTIPPNYDLDDC
jgi:acetyl-CoA carboxylase biotin carboxylase subunit